MCELQDLSNLPLSRHFWFFYLLLGIIIIFFKYKLKKSLLILGAFRLVVSSEHDLGKKILLLEEACSCLNHRKVDYINSDLDILPKEKLQTLLATTVQFLNCRKLS